MRGCSSEETTFHQSARTSPPEQPRPAGHPGPGAARHRFGVQPPGSWTAGLLPRRAGAGAAGPSRFPDSGPGVREGGLCLSRRGRRTRRDSQNRCVSPLARRTAPTPSVTGSAAPPCPRPFPARPGLRQANSTPLLPGFRGPGGIGIEDALVALPRRSFCLSLLGSFSICGKNPGGGQRRRPAPLPSRLPPA